MVVVLAVLIVQMVTKNEPDYTLNIVTEKPLAQPVLNWLKAELEVYGQDLDGDGYVEWSHRQRICRIPPSREWPWPMPRS